MKRLFFIWMMALLALSSCKTKSTEERAQIMVTIQPLQYFAEAIAGDRYQIHCMVPQGVSPETYDPTPQQLMDLSNSQALFYTGYLGFEQLWMQRLQENAPDTRFFKLSDRMQLIKETETHSGHAHVGGVEPHIWSSPRNALILVENIYRALCDLDSINSTYYQSNLELERQKIEETDKQIKSILSQPNRSKAFMIYHPTLSYFAQEYGLTQLSIEEEGKEPSPGHLKELIETAREKKVKVIFIQPEFDKRNATVIAKEIGAELISINPLSYVWHQELIRIAKALN